MPAEKKEVELPSYQESFLKLLKYVIIPGYIAYLSSKDDMTLLKSITSFLLMSAAMFTEDILQLTRNYLKEWNKKKYSQQMTKFFCTDKAGHKFLQLYDQQQNGSKYLAKRLLQRSQLIPCALELTVENSFQDFFQLGKKKIYFEVTGSGEDDFIKLALPDKETYIELLKILELPYEEPPKYKQSIRVFNTHDQGDSDGRSENKRILSSLFLSPEVENKLTSFIEDIRNPEKYPIFQQKGIKIPNTLLLTGPPGTGKTSIGFAIASELDYDYVSVNFEGKILNRLRNGWYSKSVIVFDDFNLSEDFKYLRRKSLRDQEPKVEPWMKAFSLKKNKKNENEEKEEVNEQTKITILQELMNYLDNPCPNQVLIFTANDISELDESIFRPGRMKIIRVLEMNIGQFKNMLTTFQFTLPSDELLEKCLSITTEYNTKMTTSYAISNLIIPYYDQREEFPRVLEEWCIFTENQKYETRFIQN